MKDDVMGRGNFAENYKKSMSRKRSEVVSKSRRTDTLGEILNQKNAT